MTFADRHDAGRQLADRIAQLVAERGWLEPPPVVVGMARGGLPVAQEVAVRLGGPLDVVVVRKIGCPWQPELGVGALAEGEVMVTADALIAELGLRAEEIAPVVDRERRELARRVARYRGGRAPVDVAGRVVVLVDDGMATGGTAQAAIRSLRTRGAAVVIVGFPVGPRDAAARLGSEADALVVVSQPAYFMAIGEAYRDFHQITDEEVEAILGAMVASAPAPATPDATEARVTDPPGGSIIGAEGGGP